MDFVDIGVITISVVFIVWMVRDTIRRVDKFESENKQ